MLLTLFVTGEPVYINPDAIAFITKAKVPNEETGEECKFSRVYLRGMNLPEDIPCWVDVKESVRQILGMIREERLK